MNKPASFFLIYLGLTLLTVAHAEDKPPQAEIHVSPEGNDQWSGQASIRNADATDGPRKTLKAALERARAMRAAASGPLAVTVYVHDRCWLDEPLTIRPDDSGTKRAPLRIESADGNNAVLSGGTRIVGWSKTSGPIWEAPVPQVRNGTWYFRQLFIDGRRATRCRGPNAGYFRAAGLVDPKPSARWNEGVDRFFFENDDLRPWDNLSDVEVVVLHSWNASRVRIADVVPAGRIVRFTGPTIFRPFGWDPDQRYYVENARPLLDEPGEWFLDRERGVVLYWPLPGEDMRSVEVIAPRLTELVRFEGNADEGRLVEHVHLKGLALRHADWSLSERGYGDPQAAVSIPAAVMLDGARDCTIRNCEIAHVGNYGLWLRRGCKQNTVEQNEIWDLGAGGVRVGEPKMPPEEAVTSSDNRIHNNYLHDGGNVYLGAVGLWLAHAHHNTISHNEIHSFNYSGMSIGWNWNEAPNRTDHNTIEFNHIHHVVRGVLSDAGGIYTLGTQVGTVLRNNVIHDIFPYMGKPAMAWGIYHDAGSNQLRVENNIVYNTLTGGLMNAGQPENVIVNNIFAFSAWQAAWRWTWHREPSSRIERNIFYLTQGALFPENGAGRNDDKSHWDYNLYWRTDGKPMRFYGEDFAAWQTRGLGQHSKIADPKFVDPAKYDFRLKSDSPALELGFKPIDPNRAGLVGPDDWVARPRRVTFPPTELPPVPPPPPPLQVDDGFETTPAGNAPKHATVCEEERGGRIRVVQGPAAAGKHSLEVADAAGLKYTFNPHLFYQPNHRDGTTKLRFALYWCPGAIVAHEWRDSSQPYRVGPSLTVDAAGNLTAAGKTLATLPTEQWVNVEIECKLGENADGRWSLRVELPGNPLQTLERLNLPCRATEIDAVAWIGLISLADGPTKFYVDDVSLVNESP